jgi:hypothetical protein
MTLRPGATLNVSRRTKFILIAIVIALVVVAARLELAFARYSRVERRFESVRVGDSKNDVIAKIGKPNYHAGKCGLIHAPDKACALEYVYSHPFAPIVPKYHIVAFSPDDRVIEASEWDSP